MKNFNTIFCSFGLAEEASLALIPFFWNGENSFKNRSSAICSLANFLKKKYDNINQPRSCCVDNSQYNFCPQCGNYIENYSANEREEFFKEFLRKLPHETNNSWGYDDNSDEWLIGDYYSFKIPIIVLHNAESIILTSIRSKSELIKLINNSEDKDHIVG